MSKTKIVILSVLVAIVIFGMSLFSWVTGSYNSMVTERETVSTLWSQVETQYQRRYDLIPNLANSTKGYMAHEQAVYKDIADARTHYANAPMGSEDKVQATSQLEGALSRLMVIMENYPNLKADQTVKGLMDELAGTENRVTVARERYNEATRDYNIDIKRFPKNVLAIVFNFLEKPLFTVQTQDASQAPKVDLEVK
jgi:LemA protein